MTRWQFRTSASCPRCGQVLEDKAHTTQCPEAEVSLTWQHSLKELEKWLRDSNTAHELLAAIIWGLQQWREPHRDAAPPVGQFVHDQMIIGWEQVSIYTRKSFGRVSEADAQANAGLRS